MKKIKELDYTIGNILRQKRQEKGFSQNRLGKAIGITFQQIQKYEKGINRISASTLWELSQVLNIKITYFFENQLEIKPIKKDTRLVRLMDNYNKLDEDLKKNVCSLVRSMAKG